MSCKRPSLKVAQQGAAQAIRAFEASLKAEVASATQELRKAAQDAQKASRRFSGGMWAVMAAAVLAGALLTALVVFLVERQRDAANFGQFPGIYCRSAGGQVVTQENGSEFCAVWITTPQQAAEDTQ